MHNRNVKRAIDQIELSLQLGNWCSIDTSHLVYFWLGEESFDFLRKKLPKRLNAPDFFCSVSSLFCVSLVGVRGSSICSNFLGSFFGVGLPHVLQMSLSAVKIEIKTKSKKNSQNFTLKLNLIELNWTSTAAMLTIRHIEYLRWKNEENFQFDEGANDLNYTSSHANLIYFNFESHCICTFRIDFWWHSRHNVYICALSNQKFIPNNIYTMCPSM